MISETITIAVDFDGTIVDDEYPKVGREKLFAFETLKKLQEMGHRLILWTYRMIFQKYKTFLFKFFF